jgi:hypothetical protein
MGIDRYSITSNADRWIVSHDGNFEGDFETKEAAFQAAVAAASLALKQGHDVQVSVVSNSIVTQPSGVDSRNVRRVATLTHADGTSYGGSLEPSHPV